MSFATRDGRRIHFEVQGEGQAVVLLPGLGSGKRLFGTLPRRFEREGLQAITYDPRGIAPSDPLDGPFDFAQAAADVWAVVDAAGVDRVHLVGTSLGGKVALAAAQAAPDRVERLVLLASSAVVSARAKRVYRFFELVAATMPPESFADVVAPFLFGSTFHNQRPGLVDDIARSTRPNDASRALMVAQARALQEFDGTTAATNLRAPALCVAGLEDTLTDARDVRATADQIENARYLEFENAGHSLLLEEVAVWDAVRSFLQNAL